MTYQKPAIIASYSEADLISDAAVCTGYGRGGHDGGWWKWPWG